eukprot:TRINITY_DN5784_c1_g1_i1.p1 TRINITY_DN5784_c1_g1~~TRINITY_DN5784_c1_g1_i1.p1  ORF type:complete len:225 (-),score=56.09 TRINITY_DN5784_c1_g1_i1:387-1061(-)
MVIRKDNYVFVTVGTTLFDALIKVVDNPEFHNMLEKKGYTRIIMQIGNAQYTPHFNSIDISDDSPRLIEKSKFRAYYYRFKPSAALADDISSAGLVISHAGAGSTVESLSKHKPLIVVINDLLMNNHQADLAFRLEEYILVAQPATLSHVFDTDLDNYLQTRKLMTEVSVKSFGDELKRKCLSGTSKRVKTMIVLGSGGHTAEMFRELEGVDLHVFFFSYVCYG